MIDVLRIDEKTGLLYRPDTVDLTMIRGDARGYARRLPPEPGDIALDVGAHIGGATVSLLNAGAATVVAVEPDSDNAELLRRNVAGRSAVVYEAAAALEAGRISFYKGSENGTSMGSLTAIRGRREVEVEAVAFRDLLENHGVTYVKLDCEGAEHDLLLDDLPGRVERLIVEFHANHKEWGGRWPETVSRLREQGFEPDRDPNRPTEKSWVWTVAWRRGEPRVRDPVDDALAGE